MIKLGPFNYLGIDAITTPPDTEYVPDFSAKVINKARLLRIKRSDYQKILHKKTYRWDEYICLINSHPA